MSACAEPCATTVGLWEFGEAGRCCFNQMRVRNGSRNGRPTRRAPVFARQNLLDGNFVGSMGLKRDSEGRIGQRGGAAMSLAGDSCGFGGIERSRNIPGYKASNRRTGYGRDSGP